MKRFWKKVDKSGGPDTCWLWIGLRTSAGYGQISVGYKTIRAHRLSWQLERGAIPQGMLVCHKCDNPPCVNPDHLFLGTDQDNVNDCIKKGRFSSVMKLNESAVREIRKLKQGGRSFYSIAKAYGVDRATVRDVITGRSWKHVA